MGMVEEVVEDHLMGVVESQENYVEDVAEVKGVEDHLVGVVEGVRGLCGSRECGRCGSRNTFLKLTFSSKEHFSSG